MKIVQSYKEKVEERGYVYIGTYGKGEYTKDKNYFMKYSCRYIRVKCPYCGTEYDIKIQLFLNGNKCTHCCNKYENSFAYYIQQELGEPLNKYWDWEKNTVNPYLIYKSSSKQKVWIKCTETDYHGSYEIACSHFTNNKRCSYCARHSIVHPKDSLAQWLIDNLGDDALNIYWDYDKNELNPWAISYGSGKNVWIKCIEVNYHESYSIKCYMFVEGKRCPYCSRRGSRIHPKDSFAQYHIDNTDPNFLEKYWSDKNTLDPWKISPNSNKKILIKCTNINYHNDYIVSANDFLRGNRCPQCSHKSGNVHKYDSFGYLYPEKAKYWSNKNKKSPFEVSTYSKFKYWFICEKCGKEFLRDLAHLNNVDKGVVCKNCRSSQYEKRIIKWLDCNGFIENEDYIHDKPYFENLVGLGGGNLRPDFILPKLKIWIEYDGEFHNKKIYENDNYEKLIEHDEIKDQYAIKYGWNLIRIKSEDKDNIEKILENIFKEAM